MHAISILSIDAQRRVDAVAYRFIIFLFEGPEGGIALKLVQNYASWTGRRRV